MPGFPKMDEKKIPAESVDAIQVVIAQDEAPKTNRTKKFVIIAVSIVIAAIIILAAILIGVHMYTEAERKLVKYTLNFDKYTKQDVTSDPNSNTVQYEIQNAEQKTWVVNDFSRDLQVVKIQTAAQANCYVSPLNRTIALDPAQITGPDTTEINKASTLTYVTSGSPITDTSFLAKAARDICQGVSTYWLYPKCSDSSTQDVPPGSYSVTPTPFVRNPSGTPTNGSMDNSPWFVYFSYPYSANATVFCVTGCCKTVCACGINYFWYYSAGNLHCTWVAAGCPTLGVYANPVSQACANGPRGLSCPNYSPAALPNC